MKTTKTLCSTCKHADTGDCQETPVITLDCPRYEPNNIDMHMHPDAICKKCHDMEKIDCTYCYCPLYHDECGGNYTVTLAGIKDCTDCTLPHQKDFEKHRKTVAYTKQT